MKTVTVAVTNRTSDAHGGFRCHRCGGGLMVPELMYDLASSGFDPVESWGWRCVACGELVDPLILRHRRETADVGRQAEHQFQAG